MQLRFTEARAGSRRKTTICPNCGAPGARASRRTYDGLWSQVFRVRPMKCEPCGLRFPIALTASTPSDELELALHLPFIPTEMEEQRAARPRRKPQPPARPPAFSGTRCPACGSTNVRPGQTAFGPVSVLSFEVRDLFRCADCNGSFRRINLTRLFFRSLLLLAVLGGLTYVALNLQGWSQRPTAVPTIPKDQIPPPPPPVFR